MNQEDDPGIDYEVDPLRREDVLHCSFSDELAFYFLSSDGARVLAEQEGLDLILPDDNQIFIDIDNDEDFKVYSEYYHILIQFYCVEEKITESKNGLPGRHIILTLDKNVTPLERICLQACLGSDRKRELLGFFLLRNGDKTPTLFLEKGQKALPPADPEYDSLCASEPFDDRSNYDYEAKIPY